MKKILALTAAAMIMAATTAFASCSLKPVPMQNSCSIGVPTGAAAPVSYSYIVSPVQQRTYLPACNQCNTPAKKGFFSKIFTPVQNVYDATFGQIFTGLY